MSLRLERLVDDLKMVTFFYITGLLPTGLLALWVYSGGQPIGTLANMVLWLYHPPMFGVIIIMAYIFISDRYYEAGGQDCSE